MFSVFSCGKVTWLLFKYCILTECVALWGEPEQARKKSNNPVGYRFCTYVTRVGEACVCGVYSHPSVV